MRDIFKIKQAGAVVVTQNIKKNMCTPEKNDTIKKEVLTLLQRHGPDVSFTQLHIRRNIGTPCNKRGMNNLLYQLKNDGQVTRSETCPPVWSVKPPRPYDDGETKHESKARNKTEVLVAVDLGNMHKCFPAWCDNEGYMLWGFADTAYNRDAIINSEWTKEEGDFANTWIHDAGKRKIWQCKEIVKNAADVLLMHKLSTAFADGTLSKDCDVLILSKDRMLGTYATMMCHQGYQIQWLTDESEIAAHL